MSQIIELHATRDFGRKLNAVIEFIRQNFKSLGRAMLVIAGPFILIGSLLITRFMNSLFAAIFAGASGAQNPVFTQDTFGAGFFAALMGAMLFLFIGSVSVISTVNQYVILYEEKRSWVISVGEVWQRVKKNMFSVLLTMIIYAVAMLFLYFVTIILAGVLAMIHPLLIFISILVVYGCLFFATILCFLLLFVQAYEKLGFGQALNRALDLMKGHWWSTLGIVLVSIILQTVISGVFMVPFYANLVITTLHDSSGESVRDPSLVFQTINFISMGLYLLVSNILYCLPLLSVAFQYFNLVEKKEARGLMNKIEGFGAVQTSGDDEEHY